MEEKKKPKRRNMPLARFLSAVVSVSMVLSLMPSQGLEWAQQRAAMASAEALSQTEAAEAASDATDDANAAQAQTQQSEGQHPEQGEAKLALHLQDAVLVYGGDVDATEVAVPTGADMEFSVRAKDGFRVAHVLYDGAELGARFFGPFRWRVRLAKGRNVLEVTVANLLANQVGDDAIRDRILRDWQPNGSYDAHQRPFDRDNRESGLFGPLTLRRTKP